jgi:hypothetical protein
LQLLTQAAGGSPRGSTRAIMTLLNEPHGIKPHRPLRDRDEQRQLGSFQGQQLNRFCQAGKILLGPPVSS